MNNKWSKGYVADLTYSHGYYHELAPAFLRFFLLLNGFGNAGGCGEYTYCELGYGQGVSANLHAAANPRGRFWGTDFNPDHALFAQGLSQEAGVQATWMACGFEELLEQPLPQFDFIVLHGVWSWIDAAARHAIVEFIRRRLKVGGVVYLSYNIMPGWSAEKPLRDLLRLHAELAGAPGDSTAARIRGALGFAQALRSGRAAYFEHNPKAGQMLDDMLRDDVHVVAHEYFNQSWFITYFADLASTLEAAGLGFACSVHKCDLVGEVQQRRRACRVAAPEGSGALAETTHDFILNRRFRRDVFVRGAQRLPRAQRNALLQAVRLVLLRPADALATTVQTPYGSVALDASLCRRIVAVLDAAPAPLSLASLMEQAGLEEAALEPVLEAVAALVAQCQVFPVFADDAAHAQASRARALNLAVAQRARFDDSLRYLASPVTGHALEASRLERLFLLAWEQGGRTAGELAEPALAWHPGRLEPAEVAAQADRFLASVAPLWRRLGLLADAAP